MDTMRIAGLLLLLVYSCQGFKVPDSSTDHTSSSGWTDGQLTPDNYPYHVKLDDNYYLKWNFNSTHIIFFAHVKTNGYVGLGISDHGAMYPSDVIIAWVKDGQVHFADRHATGHFMPVIDPQQDWHLISGTEQGGYTTITMIRKLDTCDDNDFPVLAGTTRLIYSYSSSDPGSDDNIPYHGTTRGTKSVLLLDPPAKDTNQKTWPDDVITLDVLNNNFSVPADDTTYSCIVWKMPPTVNGKHHMIRYEPVIQKGHEHLVHHIILSYCTRPLDEKLVGTRHNCYPASRPEFYSCYHTLIAWAIGGTGFDYPSHVGHSLAGPNDPVYFYMETHYDNYKMRSDFVDNSGIRMFLTKQLRQYDAGILSTGINVDRYQIVPPFAESFLSRGYCHEECLAEGLGDNEMHVFANLLHAHLIGKSLSTRIIRKGVELEPILEDNNYDFNYQEQRILEQERTIKKGDTLITDCYYDSRKRTKVTYGGLSSREEMCLSFLLYYPRLEHMSYCATRLEYHINNGGVNDVVDRMDWTRKDVRDAFAKHMEQADIVNICSGNNFLNFNNRITSQINITVPYQHVHQCKPGTE